jgi:hypothetical protein
MNGVADRIASRGACTVENLNEALASARRPSVICDCEGYEDVLMDPVAAPALSRASMLIEMHEGMQPGVSQRIGRRFESTHRIQVIPSRPRSAADLPPGFALPPQLASSAMVERGGPTEWYYLVPR